jgi:fucose 4-O-acetylase-like acetyltransferase
VTTAIIASAEVRSTSHHDSSPRTRLHDIDRAKGLTIILVVIGHIAARDKPSGTDWFALVQFLINSFHMPFFMYLAGYVFFYSGNAFAPRPTYWGYVRRRAERLLIPFLEVGLLIVVGKSCLHAFMHVDNWVGNISSALWALIWDTANSPAESIWFVFVLFVYCVCVPFFLRVVRQQLWILLTGATLAYFLAAYLLVVPGYVYLDRVSTYLIFFLLGGLIQSRADAVAFIDRAFGLLVCCFVISLSLLALHIFEDQAFVLCNFLGIPCMHGLVMRVREGRFLFWLSRYTFVIYLLNTIVMGFTKGILLLFLSWTAASFLLLAPILGLAGLFGPILIKRAVFRRLPLVDAMTN